MKKQIGIYINKKKVGTSIDKLESLNYVNNNQRKITLKNYIFIFLFMAGISILIYVIL